MASSPAPLNWYTLTLEGHSEQTNSRPVRAIVHDLADRENIVAETWLNLEEAANVLKKVFEYPLLVEQHLDALQKDAPAQTLCAADGKSPIVFERDRLILFGFHAEDFETVHSA
jgi:hypothetical protein